MCTAAAYLTKDFYFGRTLDNECSYGEEITIMPRGYCLRFRSMGVLSPHYAIIGVAHIADNYPLYYDAVNEKGLAMAGLNFVGNAEYKEEEPGKNNVATFEFIPWILGQCASVKEAKKLLEHINLTDAAFNADIPAARLHWLIADKHACITVESVASGLQIYDNPAGVLTNNPPFHDQMFQLNNYMFLSPKSPQNRFCSHLPLHAYSLGMGAIGLPGDLSSQSRFVRASFVKSNSVCDDSEAESVSQFFHILGAVEQPRGCCEVKEGCYEYTIFTSCCNADKGIYYYTTYGNHQISGVRLFRENLASTSLKRYPMIKGEQIRMQN